jgi:hypothetical protein
MLWRAAMTLTVIPGLGEPADGASVATLEHVIETIDELRSIDLENITRCRTFATGMVAAGVLIIGVALSGALQAEASLVEEIVGITPVEEADRCHSDWSATGPSSRCTDASCGRSRRPISMRASNGAKSVGYQVGVEFIDVGPVADAVA